MTDFLLGLNREVEEAGRELDEKGQEKARERYGHIIKEEEKKCPEPPPKPPMKCGCVPKTKERNMLERLHDYEDDVLRFMTAKEIPFTNNQAERDLRGVKVHQKIFGCFRSWEGASYFCRIKSYVSTCGKHDISSADALKMLFDTKNFRK